MPNAVVVESKFLVNVLGVLVQLGRHAVDSCSGLHAIRLSLFAE